MSGSMTDAGVAILERTARRFRFHVHFHEHDGSRHAHEHNHGDPPSSSPFGRDRHAHSHLCYGQSAAGATHVGGVPGSGSFRPD